MKSVWGRHEINTSTYANQFRRHGKYDQVLSAVNLSNLEVSAHFKYLLIYLGKV